MKSISSVRFSPLFQGISDDEFSEMASCLGARTENYASDENIYLSGDCVREAGIVLDGSVLVVSDDVWGNRNIIAEIGKGEMFAEAFVCGGVSELPVSVIAETDCEIMFIDFNRVMTQCKNACVFHSRLIQNIVGILARKNIMLQSKLEHVTKRTTREKLLSYLSEQSRKQGSRVFEIPFDRQGLADYLSVDRSALSAEMSRLKAAGVISYRKNRFELRYNAK